MLQGRTLMLVVALRLCQELTMPNLVEVGDAGVLEIPVVVVTPVLRQHLLHTIANP